MSVPGKGAFERNEGLLPRASSISETRRRIGAEVTRDVILTYREAKRHYQDVIERSADDNSMERWLALADGRLQEASAALVRAILAWSPRAIALEGSWNLGYDGEKRWWRPCGVAFDGVYYMATADPQARKHDEGEEVSDGRTVMYLVEVPLTEVADLDSILGSPKTKATRRSKLSPARKEAEG